MSGSKNKMARLSDKNRMVASGTETLAAAEAMESLQVCSSQVGTPCEVEQQGMETQGLDASIAVISVLMLISKRACGIRATENAKICIGKP